MLTVNDRSLLNQFRAFVRPDSLVRHLVSGSKRGTPPSPLPSCYIRVLRVVQAIQLSHRRSQKQTTDVWTKSRLRLIHPYHPFPPPHKQDTRPPPPSPFPPLSFPRSRWPILRIQLQIPDLYWHCFHHGGSSRLSRFDLLLFTLALFTFYSVYAYFQNKHTRRKIWEQLQRKSISFSNFSLLLIKLQNRGRIGVCVGGG